MTDPSIPKRRDHIPTQSYGEPDAIYQARVETKTAHGKRVDRAETQRAIASLRTLEFLGL